MVGGGVNGTAALAVSMRQLLVWIGLLGNERETIRDASSPLAWLDGLIDSIARGPRGET
jgi:hypothetical protein